MNYTLVAVALFLAAAVALAVAWVAWGRRKAPGGRAFAFSLLAAAGWSFASGMEALTADLSGKIFWSQVQYFGIHAIPPLYIWFVLIYSHQRRWITRRILAGLWIIPAITLLLVWTNSFHALVWTDVQLRPTPYGIGARYGHGPWFWVAALYGYLLLALAAIMLLRARMRLEHGYRRQADALLLGMLITWIWNAVYIGGLDPLPGLDISALAFTISGLVWAWALFRFRFLDLVPVARDAATSPSPAHPARAQPSPYGSRPPANTHKALSGTL